MKPRKRRKLDNPAKNQMNKIIQSLGFADP